MKGPFAYMAKNHVAANILMLILLLGGLIMGRSIKQEVFPEFELDMVTVTVPYPGATPAEVEDGIVRPIELALSGVNNVKRMRSVANENVGMVTLEVMEGANADEVLQDAKSEVDRIRTFPDQAEKPIVSKMTNRREVVKMMVYGDASERSLFEQAERVRDDLLALPSISQVELSAYRPYEISIEISEENLRKYNLTLDRVAVLIRRASLDLPGGSVRTEGGEVQIRTTEKRYTGAEFDSVRVLSRPDGSNVYLHDIANVRDTFEDADLEVSFDGKRAVGINVFRVGDQTPKDIAQAVHRYIEAQEVQLPDSIQIAIWTDWSELLDSRLNLLIKNGALGLILVLIILTMFLEIRLAFWVAAGVAISFAGSLLLMPGLNISINMMSLFGFLIILGVAVDDAIIVGENIYVHRRNGKPYLRSAVDGTREISMAVIFAALTTIAAFGPLMFVSGFVGKIMWVVPAVVISVLLMSLIESLFILPSHLSSGIITSQAPVWDKIEGKRKRIDQYIVWFINEKYVRALKWAMRNRYATVAIAIAMLLVTVGTISSGILKFVFMPEIEADSISVTLTMPPGTPYEETRYWAKHIEEQGLELIAETDRERDDGGSNMAHIFSLIGQQLMFRGPMGALTQTSSNIAQIDMLLQKPENRTINTAEFAARWHERVGEIPGAEQVGFQSDLMNLGADIEVQLSHSDFGALVAASDRLKAALASYGGVRDIADSHSEGKRELKIRLRPEAASLGITETDLAMQVRGAFFGAEALRIQRGQNEVKVMVRYPEEDRRLLSTVEDMRIRTPQGKEIPFYQAAYVEDGRGYSVINRTDRRRVVNVTARVNRSTTNADEVLEELNAGFLQQLEADYPGLKIDYEGQSRDMRESAQSVMKALIFGLLMIYALLAVPFKSFIQPLVVMSAIPFGIVGAILGHLMLGYSMSMISLFGVVALNGVVVNSSLVLIDFINRERALGMDIKTAVIEAGRRRFRPIIMTAMTTFFGLSPMIAETSIQAQFLVPMAISLGFGVLVSTGITLLLVPSLYLIVEDFKSFVIRKTGMKFHDHDDEEWEEMESAKLID